ncbi:MAG TPA: C13 family peptidase [Vineibacter sp.]|nr:C13 family peptidase [Vineibacter sp.]
MRIPIVGAAGRCRPLQLLSCALALLTMLGAMPLRPVAADTLKALPSIAQASVIAAIDPSQWGALLVAGHNDKANYDFATADLAKRLQGAGVRNIRILTATPENATRLGVALTTHDEIRGALARIAGPQTGACLFFITSHASRRGIFLALDKDQQYLTARDLDRYITDACGDRPQVLILSGCYSGAMITSSMTRHPMRIILASASPATVSYGATTTERHLNFERCLINAYDAGVTTWRDMFLHALPCVEEREDWLRVPASRPEAFIGSAVANLRIPGR